MKDKLLKRSLQTNALFSAICAADALLFTEKVATILGSVEPFYVQILGIGLAVFSLVLWIVSIKRPVNVFLAQMITLMDWSWVVGSALLLLFAGNYFTLFGEVIVIFVAVIVGGCAFFQGKGIRKLQNNHN